MTDDDADEAREREERARERLREADERAEKTLAEAEERQQRVEEHTPRADETDAAN